MADTVATLEKATPHSLTYKLVGGATPVVLSAASLLAAAAPGPLKALFSKLAAADNFASLNLSGANSGKVRTRHVEGSTDGMAAPATRTVVWGAAPNALSVTTAVGSTGQLEIRLTHSNKR